MVPCIFDTQYTTFPGEKQAALHVERLGPSRLHVGALVQVRMTVTCFDVLGSIFEDDGSVGIKKCRGASNQLVEIDENGQVVTRR